MVSYIRNLKSWWKPLRALGPKVETNPEILPELFLEASGLNESQQLMILTSTGNEHGFDKIAEALMNQHPRIQSEKRRSDDG